MNAAIICRDGYQSSLLGTVSLAMAMKRAGHNASVVFTEDALYALAEEVPWSWPQFLKPRDHVMRISLNATRLGYPIGLERDQRWTDPRRLIRAASESGVRLIACPIWSEILGVSSFPEGVERPAEEAYIKELSDADRVIGAY